MLGVETQVCYTSFKSIHAFLYQLCHVLQGYSVLEPITAVNGLDAGYTLDRSQRETDNHSQSNSHLCQFRVPG